MRIVRLISLLLVLSLLALSPLSIALAQEPTPTPTPPPASIEVNPTYPTMQAIAGETFQYEVTLNYFGDKAAVFDLRATGPKDWTVYMTPPYEKDKKITSIRLEPSFGTGTKILLNATADFFPFPDPGEYKITLEAVSGNLKAATEFKAVITSGPGGGVLPKQFLDIPVEFESFQAAGGNLGSGSMVVMDEACCMVDVTRYFLDFSFDESCGKCTPCREGTKQLLEILTEITKGNGTEEHLTLMEELCATMAAASLCGLGQSAVNPVLSTLKHFRDEYEAHVREKKCPALVCRPLLKYTVDPETCTGCLACLRECQVGAITGEVEEPQEIDQELCVKCGNCHAVCKFDAVKVES